MICDCDTQTLLSTVNCYAMYRETLMMAAHIRMPGHATASEKEAFVEDLIKRLGLTKAANSVVGDKKKRGLSGGEKKRLSIGAELIAEPVLLFTDEPTTGLDSFQAEKVGCLLSVITGY